MGPRAKFGAFIRRARARRHLQSLRSGALRRMAKSSVAKVMTQIRAPSRLLSARCSARGSGLRVILDPRSVSCTCVHITPFAFETKEFPPIGRKQQHPRAARGALAELGELLACCRRRRRSPSSPLRQAFLAVALWELALAPRCSSHASSVMDSWSSWLGETDGLGMQPLIAAAEVSELVRIIEADYSAGAIRVAVAA